MFNDVYSVDYQFKLGRKIITAFAVKKHYLCSEILLVTRKGTESMILAEMPDEIRMMVLELNNMHGDK